VKYREVVGRALAAAFLDGEWSKAKLVARGADALGQRPRWLHSLARQVLKAFPAAPHAEPRRLARHISGTRSFLRACSHAEGRPKVVHLHMPLPRMGRARWPVPAIATPGDLADWLRLSNLDLEWLADRKGLLSDTPSGRLHHYRYLWLPKATGGLRLLERPKTRLKEIQRRILHEILDPIPPHAAAHGFRKGRSVVTFAEPHADRRVVLRLDLADFFPTLTATRVRAVFAAAGYPDEVAATLAALCTNRVPHSILVAAPRPATTSDRRMSFPAPRRLTCRHLPQGAPTSPALANLCAFRLDVRLTAAAARAEALYTRYADDLAFSGDGPFARSARRFQVLAGAIALDEGFSLNFRKTRIMPASGRQRLAGVVVNRHPNVARADFDRLKAILTNCIRHGPSMQNRDGVQNFRSYLEGRVSWVAQVNPDRGQRLRVLLERIEWDATPDGQPVART
jgi:hypothetical protein